MSKQIHLHRIFFFDRTNHYKLTPSNNNYRSNPYRYQKIEVTPIILPEHKTVNFSYVSHRQDTLQVLGKIRVLERNQVSFQTGDHQNRHFHHDEKKQQPQM